MKIHIPIIGWDIFIWVKVTEANQHSLGGFYLFGRAIWQVAYKGSMYLFGIRTQAV